MSDREIMDAKNGITSRKEYGFRDPVVRNVVDKFVSRSDIGYSKYGSTLDDERRLKMKGLTKYLNDVQEELMDAVLYIQAAREELQDLSEESLIRKWASNRGLYKDGDPKTQALKLVEEVGETCKAILKSDQAEIEDGIGDCVVVLTNLAHLCNTDIEHCIELAYNEIKDRKGKMDNGTFKKD